MKKTLNLLLLLVSFLSFGQGVESLESKQVYYRPINLFTQPEIFINRFDDESIPVTQYTDQEVEIQKSLNEKEESVIVYSEKKEPEYKYVYDKEEITPYTWKWIHFEKIEENGSLTEVHLRRPNNWFKQFDAKVGNTIEVNFPNVGFHERLVVKSITPNQLDTRFWDLKKEGDLVHRPILGKIGHSSTEVVDVFFNGVEKPLSVTKNHLIWSLDKEDWIKVEDFKVGERIKTKFGELVVDDLKDKTGPHIVYDLEVYRDHNFLVSFNEILAHNGCEWKVPNNTYSKNGYNYKSNTKGLVSEASGSLRLEKGRKSYNSKSYDKGKGDHAGHLIGDVFGGSGSLGNIVTMSKDVNLKVFRDIEKVWQKTLEAKGTVDVKIKVNYSGGSKKPISFDVSYSLNGGKKVTTNIPNVNN